MKTINEIRDNYANERGFDDWADLVKGYAITQPFALDGGDGLIGEFLYHESETDQLIQDELKKKISNEVKL